MEGPWVPIVPPTTFHEGLSRTRGVDPVCVTDGKLQAWGGQKTCPARVTQ